MTLHNLLISHVTDHFADHTSVMFILMIPHFMLLIQLSFLHEIDIDK